MGTVGTVGGSGGGGAPREVLVGPVWGTTFLGVSVNAPVCEDTIAIDIKQGNHT